MTVRRRLLVLQLSGTSGSKSAVKLNLQDIRDFVSGPFFTTDLAICRQMYAADLSTVGGILTGDSAMILRPLAPASHSRSANDEFARSLTVPVRLLTSLGTLASFFPKRVAVDCVSGMQPEHGHLVVDACVQIIPVHVQIGKPMFFTMSYTTVS